MVYLTDRERQILKHIALGGTSRGFSDKHFISFETVKWHRKNLYKKIKLNKLSDVTRYAVENGIIKTHPLGEVPINC